MSGFASSAAAQLSKVTGGLGGMGTAAAVGGVAIAAGVVVGVKALFDLGASFDSAYDRIQKSTGASTKVMAGLKESFRDTLEQVPSSMSETADAVGGLNATLGISGSRLTEVSTALLTFSRVTGTDVKQNVTDFSRVMGDWSISSAQAELTMDKLLRTSQLTQIPMQQLMQTVVSYGAPMRSLGFSFEETIALLGKWQKEGVNTETVLRGMKQGLAQVAQDGGRFANVLKEDFPDAFKQFEAANTLADRFRIGFNLVVDTFQKFGEVPAADLSTKLFGARAGPDVFAAIREGRFDVQDLMGEISKAGGTVSDTAAKTDDWAEKWDTLVNKLKVKLEPVAMQVFVTANKWLDTILGKTEKAKRKVDEFGNVVEGRPEEIGKPPKAEHEPGWFDKFSSWWDKNGNIVWNVLTLGGMPGHFLNDTLPVLQDFGTEAAHVFGDQGIAGDIHAGANGIRDAIVGIFDFDWFTTAREGVQNFFGGLPGWIVTFFTGPEQWLWEKGSAIIGGLLSGASAKFLEFLGWIGGIGWNVILWIGDAGVWLWQKGVDLVQGLWNGATSWLGSFLGWIGGIGGAVLGAIGDLGGVLWDAGAALLGGLIGGAKGAWNAFAGFWNDLRIPGFEITMPSAIPNIKWGGFDFPDLPTFEKGGIVPGAPGQGVPIMAHAGELVVPADQAKGMVGGVPGAELVTAAADDALTAQQKYVDESTALLEGANELSLASQSDWQTGSIEGLTATTDALTETWSTGLGAMVQSTGDYLTLLNAGAQAQYGMLAFATGSTMTSVVDTMTMGSAQAADSFVAQLGARIPPLQGTLAGYSESVKTYGRDFLTAIGVPAGFRKGGLFATVDPRVPQIASDGSYGVFAERGTGGEALIPKHGAADPFGVLSTAASWYGYGLTPYQAGGLTIEELFFRDQGWDLGQFIGTVSGHYDHVHAGAGLGHMWPELDAYLVSRGITPGPGSTTGGSHANGSLHYQGRAKDYGDAANPVDAIYNAFLPLAMGMAATALERAVVPAPPDFGPGILGNGLSPGMALGMAQIMQLQMQTVLDRAYDELMARMTPGASGGGAFGDLQAYAGTKLAGFGWGFDQLAPLIELWNRESGWNPNAVNPSSGAWGIAQFLGKGAPTWNAYEQIDRGLAYIAERYGSPAAALAFHNRNNWYRAGGLAFATADSGRLELQPGLNAVYNGLGRVESLAERGSGGAHIELNVNIEGNLYGDGEAERAFEAMAERSARKLERALNRKLGGGER